MLKRKFYIILFLAALIIICYSFACQISGSIAINISDTYYVVSNMHLFQLYAILLILLGLTYLVFDKIGIKAHLLLSQIHTYRYIDFVFDAELFQLYGFVGILQPK